MQASYLVAHEPSVPAGGANVAASPAARAVRLPAYLPLLDGGRALSCLTVLLVHCTYSARFEPLNGKLVSVAMDFFFALSGFLIARILLENKRLGVPLREFVVRRALRLMPAYYLTVLIVAVIWDPSGVAWWLGYVTNFQILRAFTVGDMNLAQHAPIGHSWSLGVEEHFYVMMALVFLALPLATIRRVLVWLAPLTAIAMIVLEQTIHSPLVGLWFYFFSPFRLCSFGLGILWAVHEGWIAGARRSALRLGLGLALAGLALTWRAPLSPAALEAIGHSLLAGGLLLCVLTMDSASGLGARVLGNPVLRYVGRISYGLYLYHLPIYFALGVAISWSMPAGTDMGVASPWKAVLAMVTVVVAASASYRWFEAPILRRRTTVTRWLSRERPVTAS
ncbi:MAG TPA: acyltransferase [Kofleriaceae bacterium]|nr:acyltransferase [Kofleriaceae bacterium]